MSVMCQDQVRNKFFFQFLKLHLNPRMKRREKAIAVVSDRYLLGLGSFEEQTRSFYRFPLPYWIRAEHLPADLAFRVLLQQPQDRPATSHFNAVPVCAQA